MFMVKLYIETSSSSGRIKEGAYGYYIEYQTPSGKTVHREGYGRETNTTGNRLALLALVEGMERLTKSCEVQVITGNESILNTLKNHLLPLWQKNGWITSKKEPVKNRDLWQKYLDLQQNHLVTAEKGFNQHKYDMVAGMEKE